MDLNEKIIESVRKHSCLYEPSDKNYKNAVLKTRLWQQIAEQFNETRFLLLIIAPCLGLHMREPPPPARVSRNTPQEGWVDVRVNHFMAYDTRTYPMRYYYNSEFAGSTNSNIVIFVGGEWAITESWTQAGLAYEMAQQMNAGLFYTEHRFYGSSRPFVDSDLPNLSFLSIDQALADLAQFIQYVKSDAFDYGRYTNASVALVGCSYAGTMATWMRLAYPHLVDAAFSDSGPLHAQENFPEYLEVITEAIRVQGGETCVSNIEVAMKELWDLLHDNPAGPQMVSEMFKTCTFITTTPLDLVTFFWYGITETFAALVQFAVPGQIPAACVTLNNTSVASHVQRLANFITSSPWSPACIETRYSQVVDNHRNTSFDAYESTMRLWTYQTCVEFGWWQTTNSTRQPFLHTVPLEYFHQMCQDFFSPYFNETRLRSGIARTNMFFGGLTHLPDRVVSVAGGHDPWSPMGPNATHAHHNAPVYVVPGVSHCRAITSSDSSDTEELAAVKKAVLEHMYEYIVGPVVRPPPDEDIPAGATSLAINVVLLLAALYVVV